MRAAVRYLGWSAAALAVAAVGLAAWVQRRGIPRHPVCGGGNRLLDASIFALEAR